MTYEKQKSVSHSSGDWKSKMREAAWLGSGEDLFRLQTIVFWFYPPMMESRTGGKSSLLTPWGTGAPTYDLIYT